MYRYSHEYPFTSVMQKHSVWCALLCTLWFWRQFSPAVYWIFMFTFGIYWIIRAASVTEPTFFFWSNTLSHFYIWPLPHSISSCILTYYVHMSTKLFHRDLKLQISTINKPYASSAFFFPGMHNMEWVTNWILTERWNVKCKCSMLTIEERQNRKVMCTCVCRFLTIAQEPTRSPRTLHDTEKWL